MAKEYSFYLGKSLEKLLKNPIKNQLDLVRLILRTAQEIINPVSDTREIKDEKFVEKDEGFRIVYPDLPKEKLQKNFFSGINIQTLKVSLCIQYKLLFFHLK